MKAHAISLRLSVILIACLYKGDYSLHRIANLCLNPPLNDVSLLGRVIANQYLAL